MIPPITYALPEHKRNTPKIPEIEAGEIEIHRSLSSNRGKLALSYHEAAHALHFKRNGIQTKYLGPAITHDCPTDSYFACYGSVQMKYRDYLRLALEDPDAFLKTLVAGEVAELVLIGKIDPRGERERFDGLPKTRSQRETCCNLGMEASEGKLLPRIDRGPREAKRNRPRSRAFSN
jgi:hypothetical protein